MARIDMIPAKPTDPELAQIFDEVRERGVDLPNLYRVLGASPKMLRTWIDFAWSLRLDATTPRDLRELIIMRGAYVADSQYEWAQHWPMAVKSGVPEEKLNDIGDWRSSTRFSAKERAVLKMTDEVTQGPGASSTTIDEMKAHFTSSEIIELTLTASFYVCVARMLASLDVDIEPNLEPHLNTL